MECGAILDVLGILKPVHSDELAAAKGLLTRIVEMLTKMCR